MDIYKLKFTVLQQEIFRFLCLNAGKAFTARSLARKLDVSPTSIGKSLPSLKKEGLVFAEKDEESGRMAIGFNSGSLRARNLKRVENLSLIYESGLTNYLHEKFSKAKAIILTGDLSKGIESYDSPITITILRCSEKKIDLSSFESSLGKKISLSFLNNKTATSSKLRNLILEGAIVLTGGEDGDL